MSFDITKQAKAGEVEDEGTFVHIHGLDDLPMYFKDEQGEEQPVGITVTGAHSTKFRQVEAALRKRKLRPRDLTGERLMEDNIERVARCTLSWQGFSISGEMVRMTFDNAKELYRACPWVLEQVSEAMQDHSRFFKTESNS